MISSGRTHNVCGFGGGGVWFGFFNVRLVIVLVELGKKKREGFA